MSKTEKQQSNIETLLKLIKDNPTLRVVPMVGTEVGGRDSVSWRIAEWGTASIEEIYDYDERVYIRSNDEDELIENEKNRYNDEDINDCLTFKQTEERAEERVKNYEWKKVIAVAIWEL